MGKELRKGVEGGKPAVRTPSFVDRRHRIVTKDTSTDQVSLFSDSSADAARPCGGAVGRTGLLVVIRVCVVPRRSSDAAAASCWPTRRGTRTTVTMVERPSWGSDMRLSYSGTTSSQRQRLVCQRTWRRPQDRRPDRQSHNLDADIRFCAWADGCHRAVSALYRVRTTKDSRPKGPDRVRGNSNSGKRGGRRGHITSMALLGQFSEFEAKILRRHAGITEKSPENRPVRMFTLVNGCRDKVQSGSRSRRAERRIVETRRARSGWILVEGNDAVDASSG